MASTTHQKVLRLLQNAGYYPQEPRAVRVYTFQKVGGQPNPPEQFEVLYAADSDHVFLSRDFQHVRCLYSHCRLTKEGKRWLAEQGQKKA